MGERRGLAANHRAGIAQAPDRLARHVGAELLPVVEVRHDGDALAGSDHPLQQTQHVVRVGVADETERPECQRLGSDPDIAEMVETGIVDERLQVALHHPGLHHHGIAAGDQQVADVGMGREIVVQAARLVGGDLVGLLAHELGPAEAERAVGVTGLPLAREKQHGLAVLVLQPFHRPLFGLRNVQLPLACGVGVELVADLEDRGVDLLRRDLALQQVRHQIEVLVFQHPPLRKGDLIDRVSGNVVPVDQVVDQVPVRTEGQHAAHHPHREAFFARKLLQLGQVVEVFGGDGAETFAGKFGRHGRGGRNPHRRASGTVFVGSRGCLIFGGHDINLP